MYAPFVLVFALAVTVIGVFGDPRPQGLEDPSESADAADAPEDTAPDSDLEV